MKKLHLLFLGCFALVSCSSGGESTSASSTASSQASSSISSATIYEHEVSGVVRAWTPLPSEGYSYLWGDYQLPNGSHPFASYFKSTIAGDVISIAFSNEYEEGYMTLETYPPMIQLLGKTVIDAVQVKEAAVLPIDIVDGIPQSSSVDFTRMLCPAGYALAEDKTLVPLSSIQNAYASIRTDVIGNCAAAIYAFSPR